MNDTIVKEVRAAWKALAARYKFNMHAIAEKGVLLHENHMRQNSGAPSPMRWITVVAYFTTSLASIVLSFQKPNYSFRIFWIGLSLLLLLLGIDKQLDLQSFLTDIGRIIARRQGWYGKRRKVQIFLVTAVFTVSIFSVAALLWNSRFLYKQFLFPLAGLVLLLGFIIIRAVSLHHVDRFIKIRFAGIKINPLLELGAIGIILFPALNGILLGGS